MGETLYLKQMELGPMQNFVYLIGDPRPATAWSSTRRGTSTPSLDEAAADGMRLTGVLVTHTHQDHVGGHLFGHDIPGIAELMRGARRRSTSTRRSASSSRASAGTSSRSRAATRSPSAGSP